MTIKTAAEIEVPRPPNFLRLASGGGTVPVEAVTEDGLRQLGAAWTEQLVQHAAKRAAMELGQ